MKHTFALLACCLLFWAGKCQSNQTDMGAFDKVIGQEWIHSYEENADDAKAYRESSYNFPPSRGRVGFQMMADGTFHDLRIAPTDGILKETGTWSLEKDGQSVKVSVKGETFFLTFVSLQNDVLLLKRAEVAH